MNIVTTKNCTETFVQLDKGTITVTTWGNQEGVTLIMTDDDLNTRLAGCLMWEEAQALIAALSAAQAS